MTQVKRGDTVKVHYIGKLEDGTQFDSSDQGDPLEFTLGGGEIIPGFERAVEGLEVGDAVTAEIPAGQAYGPHREELVLVVEREKFPPNIDPTIGQDLELRQPDNKTVSVVVTEVSETAVTLDANHPLAGKNLVFDIELIEVL